MEEISGRVTEEESYTCHMYRTEQQHHNLQVALTDCQISDTTMIYVKCMDPGDD